MGQISAIDATMVNDYSDDYGSDYDDPDDGESPLPKTAVYSGTESVSGNHELTEVTFAQGVTSIGDTAFYGCSSLAAITIPDGVTSIGDCAFYGYSSLTAITIPDGDDWQLGLLWMSFPHGHHQRSSVPQGNLGSRGESTQEIG